MNLSLSEALERLSNQWAFQCVGSTAASIEYHA